jgi:hypothetical protein
MLKQIDRIRDLVSSMPAKDAILGYKFLEKRDFESLQSLVASSIIRTERGLKKENPKEEYLKADLEGMEKLNMEVITYCDMLDLSRDYYDDLGELFDDYE